VEAGRLFEVVGVDGDLVETPLARS
jgi:hypothetical protein